jgi:hypothetical protein
MGSLCERKQIIIMHILTILTPNETTVTEIFDETKGKIIAFTFQGEDVEVTDSYHTLSELYEMRLALTVALFRIYDSYITPLGTRVKCWKSKLYFDGTMFDGYFIVGMTIPQLDATKPHQSISFHYKMEHWDKFNLIELPVSPPYDGHTSKDVIERLMKL